METATSIAFRDEGLREGRKESFFFPKRCRKLWKKCGKLSLDSRNIFEVFCGGFLFWTFFVYKEFCSMANSSEKVCQIAHDWAMRSSALSSLFVQQNSILGDIASCKRQEW